MKTLTAKQQTARDSTTGHVFSRFLSIAFAQAGTKYFSERDPEKEIDPDSTKTFTPILRGFPQTSRGMSLEIDSSAVSQSIAFSLTVDTTSGQRIDVLVEDEGSVIGAVVTVFHVLRPLDGSAVTESDWSTLGVYVIEAVSTDYRQDEFVVSFSCIDAFQHIADRSVGLPVTSTDFPNAREGALGKTMPIVFGAVSQAPGLLVGKGGVTTLAGEVLSQTSLISLTDGSVFPSPVTVQIGTEHITGTISTNTLTPTERGANGTTRQDHTIGSAVHEIQTNRWLFADHAVATIGATGAVKDQDGTVLPDATVAEVQTGGKSYLDISEMPKVLRPSGQVLVINGDELDVPTAWDAHPANETNSFAKAVDRDEDTRHNTAATVGKNDGGIGLIVKQTQDLSGNTGNLVKVVVAVDYEIVKKQASSLPEFTSLTLVYQESNIAVPLLNDAPGEDQAGDVGTGDDGSDTTALFVNTGSLGPIVQGKSEFLSLVQKKTSYPVNKVGAANDIMNWWVDFHNYSVGTKMNWGLGRDSARIAAGVYLVDDLLFISAITVRDLVVKIEDLGQVPDGSLFTRIVAHVEIQGQAGSDPNVSARAKLKVEDTGDFVFENVTITAPNRKTIVLELSGSFSKTDFLSCTVTIDGLQHSSSKQTLPKWQNAISFEVEDVTFFGETDVTFVGETTPSTAVVPSNRAIQRATIPGVTGWDWFGVDEFAVWMTFPSTTSKTKILVYDIRLEFHVDEMVSVPPDPATMQLFSDVTGYVGASGTAITGAEAALKILSDSAFMALDAARYDAASLTAATDNVTSQASLSADTWFLARRISEAITLRDLLVSCVSAAGIRYAIDSGKFIFFDNVRALPTDFVRELTTDVLLPGLTNKSDTPIQIVTNQVALGYDRQFIGDEELAGLDVSDVTISQALSWATRRREIATEWVNTAAIAAALADTLADDFAWPMQKVTVAAESGRTIDLEIGDILLLNNAFVRLPELAGRLKSARYDTPETQILEVIIVNRCVRIWEDSGSGSYIEVCQGRQTMTFVVNGVRTAILDASGLRILGEIDETANVPEVGQASITVYSGGISVGVWDGAAWFRGCLFKANGDLVVSELETFRDTFPVDSVRSWTDYIEIDGEPDTLFTNDKRRIFMRMEPVDVSGQQNGKLELGEVEENVAI